MELVIRVCGWSAILFVLAIFFFVLGGAATAFFGGERAAATATFPGPNNDLIFRTREYTSQLNGLGIVLREMTGESAAADEDPSALPPAAFEIDTDELTFTVDFRAGETTAQEIVDALKADSLAKILTIELASPDPDNNGLPNDGSGLVEGVGDVRRLAGGNFQLDLTEFFTSTDWRPSSELRPEYGILALLVGSLSVTALAMLIAVPFGLGAAVYVSEFSRGKVKESLKVLIEMLAAIPSVVWGFIGYMVLGPIIIKLTGAPVGINLLNGGIILALMSVPIMVSMGEDALKAVPDSYREAAVSLGATRWEVVYRVLFPAAKNGLLAAVLLGVGRAIGETMAVLMATGHAVQIPHSLLDPIRTLTATIAAELGETVEGGEHYSVLFVIGVVLFAVTFAVNLTADLVVKGIRSEKTA